MFTDILTTRCKTRPVVGMELAVLAALLAGACASSAGQQKSTAGADRMRAVASQFKPDDFARNRASALDGNQSACGLSSVYFAFDSSDLNAEARKVLQENAACIQRSKVGSVTITGMTDPRGTEEYNLALGDRRARSAAKYLSSLDLSQKPVSVRSLGEEYASGTDESGWARDRKAEFELR
jgi:peptidoglycan-associated lipoprotein